MKNTDKEVIMFDSPDLVEYRTNLEGWTGPDRLYYGKGEEGERRARHANCTHKLCECGKVMDKTHSMCRDCINEMQDKRFKKLDEIEWDGESYMCLYHDNRFFGDMDEVFEYCDDEDIDCDFCREG